MGLLELGLKAAFVICRRGQHGTYNLIGIRRQWRCGSARPARGEPHDAMTNGSRPRKVSVTADVGWYARTKRNGRRGGLADRARRGVVAAGNCRWQSWDGQQTAESFAYAYALASLLVCERDRALPALCLRSSGTTPG